MVMGPPKGPSREWDWGGEKAAQAAGEPANEGKGKSSGAPDQREADKAATGGGQTGQKGRSSVDLPSQQVVPRPGTRQPEKRFRVQVSTGVRGYAPGGG